MLWLFIDCVPRPDWGIGFNSDSESHWYHRTDWSRTLSSLVPVHANWSDKYSKV